MYPDLTPFLVGLGGAGLLLTVVLALRGPLTRRLALRQVSRRRAEAALVVAGSVLGTAIIVGSLVVGDTLDQSFKQDAYRDAGRGRRGGLLARPGQGRRRRPAGWSACAATRRWTACSPSAATAPPWSQRTARASPRPPCSSWTSPPRPASRGRGRRWPGRPPARAGWC